MYSGIFYKTLSCIFFAGVNSIVRYLSGGSSIEIADPLPVYMIMFMQNLISVCFFLPWIIKKKNNLDFKQYPIIHLARTSTAVIGVGFWYLSLKFMPMTEAVALSFTSPIITILAAVLFLKEKINFRMGLVLIIAIISSFYLIRPDKNLNFQIVSIFPIIATTIFAIDKILTRLLLKKKASSTFITFHLLLFMCPLSLIPAVYYGVCLPSLYQIPWIILAGLCGALAHLCFSKSYSNAEVTFLIPFGGAIKIISTGLVGFLAFGEYPKTVSMWVSIIGITLSLIILNWPAKTKQKTNKEVYV